MKIRLVTIGKTDTGWISTGMAVYRERLGHYINFSVTELPDIRNAASLGREQIKEREGEMLLKNLAANEYAVLLDANAAEHAARMMAMQLATDNGNQLLDEIRIQYNKQRQQEITNELQDIIGGTLA